MVALLSAYAAAVLWSGESASPTARQGAGEALSLAAQSCRSLQDFTDLVDRNAPVSAVLSAVDRAVAQARDASSADPRWISLAGGAESLSIAVRANDAQAASVGIRVVTAECARTAAPLR